MVTKVKRITGGVPSLPGDQGLTGQVLTKLSNTAGDYGWANIPQAVVSKINNAANTNVVSVTTSGTDRIDFTVGGSVRMRLTTSGIDSLQSINGTNVSGYLNPQDAPASYVDMVSPTNYTVNKQWTAEKLETLIDNSVTIPQAIPSGSITNYAGSTAPSGWLECNAQKIRAADHPSLYSAIGDTYTEKWDRAALTQIDDTSSLIEPECLTFYNDNFYYVGVTTTGSPDEIYVEATEKDFTTSLWSTRIMSDSTSSDAVPRFIKAANGEIYVGVRSTSAPYIFTSVFVTVLNATTGAIVRTFNISQAYNSAHPIGGSNADVSIDSSGNIYLFVKTSISTVRKYDPTGVLLWTYAPGSMTPLNDYDISYVSLIDESTSSLYVGLRNGISGGTVIKLNSNTGAYVFHTTEETQKWPRGISVMPNGNLMISYQTTLGNSSYRTYNSTTGSLVGTMAWPSLADESGLPSLSSSYPISVVSDPISGDVFVTEFTTRAAPYISGLTYHRVSFSGNSLILEESGYVPVSGVTTTFASYGLELFLDSDLSIYHTRKTNLMKVNLDAFQVPDLRGEFVRGWDNGRGIDSTRALGSWQDDEFESHTHLVSGVWQGSGGNGGVSGGSNVGTYPTQSTGGNETRPRNVALMYIIKT